MITLSHLCNLFCNNSFSASFVALMDLTDLVFLINKLVCNIVCILDEGFSQNRRRFNGINTTKKISLQGIVKEMCSQLDGKN